MTFPPIFNEALYAMFVYRQQKQTSDRVVSMSGAFIRLFTGGHSVINLQIMFFSLPRSVWQNNSNVCKNVLMFYNAMTRIFTFHLESIYKPRVIGENVGRWLRIETLSVNEARNHSSIQVYYINTIQKIFI
jgi:hypothetical protein